MTASPPATTSLDWFVDGYRRALARLDAKVQEREPEETFIPLFEALSWAVAILEFRRKQGLSISDETADALQFARNRVHHQWADALKPRDVPQAQVTRAVVGQMSRTVGPPTVLNWFWKPLNQLPPAPKDHPDPDGANAYSVRLEGNPARDALRLLDDLLRSLGL